MSKEFLLFLAVVSFCSFAFALSIPATTSIDDTTVSEDGLNLNTSLGVEPSGIVYEIDFQDRLPIENLQTNFIIIRVMALLAQRDLQSNVPHGETFVHPTYQDVAIRVDVEKDEPFKVNYLLWALHNTHIELAKQKGDNYVSARTRIVLYDHVVGYLLVIKREQSEQQGLLTFPNVTDPSSIITDNFSTSKRSPRTSENGKNTIFAPRTWLTTSEHEHGPTPDLTTSKFSFSGVGNVSTNENLRVTFDYVSHFDLGQQDLYIMYGNVILGLLDVFDRNLRFRVRNPHRHIEANIDLPKPRRTRPPYNTRARSIQAVEMIATFTALHRRFDEIYGSISVGGTQIFTLSFKRLR